MRERKRQTEERNYLEIMSILDELSTLTLNMRLHSHINWEFPPDKRKPVINLPLILTESPAIPAISGVRLTRRTEFGPVSVILDLQEDRSLVASLRFPFPQTISKDVIEQIVRQGTQILSEFVLEPAK